MATKNKQHCGVPQCNNYKSSDISMHNIPKEVMENKLLMKQWMQVLKMGKKLPKQFKICSKHFESKYLLARLNLVNRRKYVHLSKKVFPTEYLPKSSVPTKLLKRRQPVSREATKFNNFRLIENSEELLEQADENFTARDENFTARETLHSTQDKQLQVNLDSIFFKNKITYITSLWNTEYKLKSMTGIPTFPILDRMVENCERIYNGTAHRMSMRDKILLTMRKLKSNITFAELAINFNINFYSAKAYFVNTIQLLSQILSGILYWPTREQNLGNLPKCFEDFPNVMTILDCTEVKTVTFGCLNCRASTYSHYKCQHTIKILIGITPCGLVNFISPAVAGRASDKSIFNLTSLLNKLQPGDAVMVDKGFLIGNDLEEAGIEMIRPDFAYDTLSKEEVIRSTSIASARVHVERRIGRLKIFKISDKVPVSVLPYIDDVITVICAISNLSKPIISDDKFI